MSSNAVILDMRGERCPKPVIETRKELLKGNSPVYIDVNDDVCRENVRKLIQSMGWNYECEERSPGEWRIQAYKGEPAEPPAKAAAAMPKLPSGEDYVVLLTKETVGSGSEELGAMLMKTFLFALSEQPVLPRHIYCINGAVHLTTEGSPVQEQLAWLEQKGVPISSCGICLDFYQKRDCLLIGDITNMYDIVSALSAVHTVQI